jgi:hypothetical protein
MNKNYALYAACRRHSVWHTSMRGFKPETNGFEFARASAVPMRTLAPPCSCEVHARAAARENDVPRAERDRASTRTVQKIQRSSAKCMELIESEVGTNGAQCYRPRGTLIEVCKPESKWSACGRDDGAVSRSRSSRSRSFGVCFTADSVCCPRRCTSVVVWQRCFRCVNSRC